jgi:rfaE bifunctional protein kinase chain/domain
MAENVEIFPGLDMSRLEEILDNIRNIKVGIIGDLCMDIYWQADMTKSELSRETPHYPLPIVKEWMSPGGGGNVLCNLVDLSPSKVFAIGIVGTDWRGELLTRELKKRDVDMQGLVTSENRWTPTYCKPLRKGSSDVVYEDPRLDFANYELPTQSEEDQLINALDEAAKDINVLCVADQLNFGCISPRVAQKIVELGQNGLTIVVDSRDRIGTYTNVILKPNEIEGYRAVYKQPYPKDTTYEEMINVGNTLASTNNATVLLTLGPRGCVIFKEGATPLRVPAYLVEPPIDPVGAGDSFMSAFACSLAAGAQEFEAAAVGNRASEVILKKLGTTGTATPEEIKTRAQQIIVNNSPFAAD